MPYTAGFHYYEKYVSWVISPILIEKYINSIKIESPFKQQLLIPDGGYKHAHTHTHVKRAGLGSLSKKKDEANSFEERWTDGKVRDNERNTYGLV